ncbi:hypothetical protein AN644_01300 [Candidatus Epulonipiscium fishelsonii]|nr:hypothetical protein AN644_01300 [Epulopiscium sp. SCG-C06WGA-EpuloA1]
MNVLKILNNNAILAVDSNTLEYIFLGNGIGFKNKANTPVVQVDNFKKYKLENDIKYNEVVERVDVKYLEITAQILELVKQTFKEVDTTVLLPLADHIAFAVERIKKDMEIINPFTQDIKLLFPQEFLIAKKSAELIEQTFKVDINEDEISYITLHITSAISSKHVSLSLNMVEVIKQFISQLETEYNMNINYNSLSYHRLITHIKYLVSRMYHKEKLNLDMNDYTRSNFPFSYGKATELVNLLEKTLGEPVMELEVGYLAINIEKLIQSTLNCS